MGRLKLMVIALCLGLAQGCSLSMITIDIPDFASKSVKGIWLWRMSPETGAYQRETQFVFGAPEPTAQGEQMDYTITLTGAPQPITVTTYLARDPANPDRVILQVIHPKAEAPSLYRASTYNGIGDSPLSSETLPL